jgi:phosphonate transport system substrate-binding protein
MKKMKKRCFSVLGSLFFLISVLGAFPGVLGAAEAIQFGVIPLQSPAIMLQKFTPLADYLSKELGVTVKLLVGKDYQATMDDIAKNIVQMAYLTPTTYPKVAKQYPDEVIHPIVKFKESGSATYRSAIIVRAGSPIASVADIKGKKFAFGSEQSTSSHLMPRSMLIAAGIDIDKDLKEIKFTGSMGNVVGAVAAGMMDAGGLQESVAEQAEKQGKVKILARSGDIPQFPICVNKHLPPEMVSKIQAALLKLDGSTPDSLKILVAIDPKLTGSEKAASADYDIIREMILKLYGEAFYKK